MTTIGTEIEILRKEMEKKYFEGAREEALAISQQLDKLIALAQRENAFGEIQLYPPEQRQ